MEYPYLTDILSSRRLREVVVSRDLAQVGDFLANYVYTLLRIGVIGRHGSAHVWDDSLAQAAFEAGIRKYFPSRSSRPVLADGVEAILAYTYLNGLMSLESMVKFLSGWVNIGDMESRNVEVKACGTAFGELLKKILRLCDFEDMVSKK